MNLNIIVLGVMDAFSNLILVFFSPRVGRRNLLVSTFLVTAGALLTSSILQRFSVVQELVQTFTFIAKFTASMAYAVIYIYTAELFP